jgi:hypothetical protein
LVISGGDVGKLIAGTNDIGGVVKTGGNEIGPPNICPDVGVFRTSGEDVGVPMMADGVIGADVIGETGVGILAVDVGRTGGGVVEGSCGTPNVTGVMEAGVEKAGDDVDGSFAVVSPVTGAKEGVAPRDEVGPLVTRAVMVVG